MCKGKNTVHFQLADEFWQFFPFHSIRLLYKKFGHFARHINDKIIKKNKKTSQTKFKVLFFTDQTLQVIKIQQYNFVLA